MYNSVHSSSAVVQGWAAIIIKSSTDGSGAGSRAPLGFKEGKLNSNNYYSELEGLSFPEIESHSFVLFAKLPSAFLGG
jgi:hypothetical protein